MKFAHKIIVAAAFITATTGAAFAEENTRWTGRIVDPTGVMPATHFTLQVDPDAQAQKDMMQVLEEQGQAAFENHMEDMDQGWIRIGNSLATQIAAARVVETEQGQLIQAILDRPMALGEVVNNTRSTNYPFTMIQMEVDEQGRGKGQMLAAADLEINDQGEVEVEHLGPMPWKLTHIRTR